MSGEHSTSTLEVRAFAGASALSAPSTAASSTHLRYQHERGAMPGVRYGQRQQGRLTADYFADRLQDDFVARYLEAEQHLNLRIDQLARITSVEGWDEEGGQVVTATQWEDARSIASRVMLEMIAIPAPFVSACGDGTAHLQWTTASGDRGVIEIGRDRYWWSLLSISGERDELVELRLPDEAFPKIRALFG